MISEMNKIQQAIYPQTVSSAGTTSIYFNLAMFTDATFVWDVVPTGLTMTSTGLVYQATDEAGTSAASITATSTVVYATSNLTEATITPSISAGETGATIEINGLTFTGLTAGSTATASDREFLGSTANASTTITNLAAAINDVGYGVPGVRALAGSATLTLYLDEDPTKSLASGYEGLALTSSSTTDLTIGARHMQGIIEIVDSKLTLSSNFTHVGLNVINISANTTAAVIIRGGARYLEPDPYCPKTQV
jgi:hypothetical protein